MDVKGNKVALPDEIFELGSLLPAITINLTIHRHEDLGMGITRAVCTLNDCECKRLTEYKFGQFTNESPIWCVDNLLVNNQFSLILETEYQKQIEGQTIIIQKYKSR
jgi:hypothetical protein